MRTGIVLHVLQPQPEPQATETPNCRLGVRGLALLSTIGWGWGLRIDPLRGCRHTFRDVFCGIVYRLPRRVAGSICWLRILVDVLAIRPLCGRGREEV